MPCEPNRLRMTDGARRQITADLVARNVIAVVLDLDRVNRAYQGTFPSHGVFWIEPDPGNIAARELFTQRRAEQNSGDLTNKARGRRAIMCTKQAGSSRVSRARRD